MLRIIEGILSDPRTLVSLLGALPGLIATIFMALVGHHFWFHKIGTHFRTIAIGALLSVLAYLTGFGTNYLLSSRLPIDQFITVISVNQGVAGLGHLLFCLGIYNWIRTMGNTPTVEEPHRGPFIS